MSAQGPGTQQIESDLRSGNWAVVVMNADGSRPVAVDLQAGVRSRFLAPVTLGTLMTGLALLVIGIPLLVVGAAGLGRSAAPTNLPPRGWDDGGTATGRQPGRCGSAPEPRTRPGSTA